MSLRVGRWRARDGLGVALVDREQRPRLVGSLYATVATGLEPDPGAGHEVLDGGRGQDLSRGGQRRDPGGAVDDAAGERLTAKLAGAGVEADADGAAESGRMRGDRGRGADRAGRAVESAE